MSEEQRLYQPERIYEPRDIIGGTAVILGMGASNQQYWLELYQNPEMRSNSEVWTVNWGVLGFDHDLAFNCHNFFDKGYGDNVRTVYAHRKLQAPLVTLFAQEDMPYTHSFPYKQVVETFRVNYLENSVAYAVAYACLCKAKGFKIDKVRLFGCDYNYRVPGAENMYELGRCCVEFWIGIAHHMGIDIGSATISELLDTNKRLTHGAYGYYNWQPYFEVDDSENQPFLRLKGFNDPRKVDAVIDELVGMNVEQLEAVAPAESPME